MNPTPIILTSTVITLGVGLLLADKLEEHRRYITALRGDVRNAQNDIKELQTGRGRE